MDSVRHKSRRFLASSCAQRLFAARGRMTPAPNPRQRRRRGVPSTEDLLRALRAAQSVGWTGAVAVEHDGEKTVVRFEPGAVETPNQRGLTVVP
jgi:hypothetical protein